METSDDRTPLAGVWPKSTTYPGRKVRPVLFLFLVLLVFDMDTPQIDPDRLSLKASAVPLTSPVRRQRAFRRSAGEWFIKGPIPGPWIARAAALGGRALKVALAICCEAGMKRTRTVRLSAETLRRFSLRPQGTRRALAALAQAGLVTVKQDPGRKPMITMDVSQNQ